MRTGWIGIGFAVLAASAAAGPTPEPAASEVWVELESPGEGESHQGPVDWLEVRGWAGAGTPVQHDVAIVVDVSGSTMYASGVDVDGDGKLGRARRRIDTWRSFNPRHYSSDSGDTILAAELVATRRLLDRFDLGRTRVGLLAFSEGVEVLAPVGADRSQLDAGLGRLEENFGSGATNMQAATRVALEALLGAGGAGRRKSVLILSDGFPTLPHPARRAAEAALDAAREAGDAGVRLYTFELGVVDPDVQRSVYALMAFVSSGTHVRLDQPGEIVHELPRIDLAEVAGVEIENLGSGARGRATRVFPDGTFDGFVQLVPGENRLRVTARGSRGGSRHIDRTIVYTPRQPSDDSERLAFDAERAAFRERLETRAVESSLAAEARSGRDTTQQRQELEMEVERGR